MYTTCELDLLGLLHLWLNYSSQSLKTSSCGPCDVTLNCNFLSLLLSFSYFYAVLERMIANFVKPFQILFPILLLYTVTCENQEVGLKRHFRLTVPFVNVQSRAKCTTIEKRYWTVQPSYMYPILLGTLIFGRLLYHM